jgi:hypothetical protein
LWAFADARQGGLSGTAATSYAVAQVAGAVMGVFARTATDASLTGFVALAAHVAADADDRNGRRVPIVGVT